MVVLISGLLCRYRGQKIDRRIGWRRRDSRCHARRRRSQLLRRRCLAGASIAEADWRADSPPAARGFAGRKVVTRLENALACCWTVLWWALSGWSLPGDSGPVAARDWLAWSERS